MSKIKDLRTMHNDLGMRWRDLILMWPISSVKSFFIFLKRIPKYRKLENDYGCGPDTFRFIIEQYTTVLCERTHGMSKPTYHAEDVIAQLDDWYEDELEEIG